MIAEHDSVVLTKDLPESGLVAGDVGIVVHVYRDRVAYEVEFVSLDGSTIAVETLEGSAIRAAARGDVPHVRELAA
ncbi:MAG TPA: DUF4926 domain-containing protein [Casimicrobiaceae bacterium]